MLKRGKVAQKRECHSPGVCNLFMSRLRVRWRMIVAGDFVPGG